MSPRVKLGFLASGNGSSAEAIVQAVRAGELAAEPTLLVTNRRDAPALAWAREAGLETMVIATQADPAAADLALANAMAAQGVELIILSGYLRRLGPAILARYAGRILNIHPGPLPQFGGEGMYGARVHAAVLAAGVAESAIVIHAVDAEYDHGPEIARRMIPILRGDAPEDLETRVKTAEPGFFIETLRQIAEGRLPLPQTPSAT